MSGLQNRPLGLILASEIDVLVNLGSPKSIFLDFCHTLVCEQLRLAARGAGLPGIAAAAVFYKNKYMAIAPPISLISV